MTDPIALPCLVRSDIDGWPVATAGFSARVVHCLEQAGVKTVGELRPWTDPRLLNLRNFGAVSLRNVRWFFEWTRRLEAGDYALPNYRAFLREFLDDSQLYVLEHRAELRNRLFRPQMRRCTLQEIADRLGGLSRERVRQVESIALTMLHSRLCGAAGAAIELPLAKAIEETDGVVTSEELGSWVGRPLLGDYQPWGTLLLISETMDRIHHCHGCFYTTRPEALDRLEKLILPVLQQATEPVPLEQVRAAAAAELAGHPGEGRRTLKAFLDHHFQITATHDGRYFLPATGAARVITDLMRRNAVPLHYREVTRLYNEQVLPRNRVGPGLVLRLLKSIPEVESPERAMYQPRPGATSP